MITLGYFAGVFVVAYFNKRAAAKKVNIGSDKK
jgi:hypothetical protein